MLIAIEGVDASGKNTQATAVAKRLFRETRSDAEMISFPRYYTTLGRLIERHLMGIVSLREEHAIDSSDHTIDGTTVYRPDAGDALMFQTLMLADKCDAAPYMREQLARGGHVVCDRWTASAVCYGGADGLDRAWIYRMQSVLPAADLNVFLDVPVEEALRRRPQLRDRYEKDREKQATVRANYEALWSAMAGPAWVRVDGVGSVEAVTERIWTEILRKVRL